MGRIRSHLTYANVMVTILAFIVLGGGTAIAAFVVSSNSQIGPNTIYGHRAPAGANKNIVAGSVNGQDVADNSLGGADIIEENLTGRTRKLIYNAAASPSGPVTTIASLDTYTIKGQCREFPDLDNSMHAALYVNGPAGTADWMATETFDDARGSDETGSRRGPIPASRNTLIFTTFSQRGH